MIVAGADGCAHGWVVAVADDTSIEVNAVAAFDEVLALLDRGVRTIAVDMPIGLPAAGRRACDVDARRRLGPRRASVFPAPVRPLLDARTYAEALATKRAIDGVGLSKQTFFLLPKIAEIDRRLTPTLQQQVVESHPELAFSRLAGAPLASSKRTREGRAERADLLTHALGSWPGACRGAVAHDVLDAVALTLTARRLVAGTADRLGDGERDERGLRMEIAW